MLLLYHTGTQELQYCTSQNLSQVSVHELCSQVHRVVKLALGSTDHS